MNILNTSIICTAYLCLTANDFYSYLALNITSLIESSLLIIILCYSCGIIPKRIRNYSNKILALMSVHKNHLTSIGLTQDLIQIKMNLIKRKTGFTALSLNKINSESILSFCAFIINYSVIIIQTSYSQS
jgi:hypothetical protein